jgi:hypothetical protein
MNSPNAQYNLAKPDSLAVRLSSEVRRKMFGMFMNYFSPQETDLVLDLGVTSDQSYESSNYFEALYPYKHRVVAAGLQEAAFLEAQYPGVRYVQANALDLPFPAGEFDLVHSAAVLEHVGSLANQARMIAECVRVARRGICLTTPNCWYPIEFHTQLPLVHWLPKPAYRRIFHWLGIHELAREENLNLMTKRELRGIARSIAGWRFDVADARLFGWKSNVILFGRKR